LRCPPVLYRRPAVSFCPQPRRLHRAGPITPHPTREKDHLKHEEQQILRSIVKLQSHYGAIRAATETALAQIDAQQDPAAPSRN